MRNTLLGDLRRSRRSLPSFACSKQEPPPPPPPPPADERASPPKARRASRSRRTACTCSTACTAAASPRWCSSTAGPAIRTTGANRCRQFKQEIHAGHGGSRRPRRHRRQPHATGAWRTSARTWPPRCRPCLTSSSSWSGTRWAARWPSRPRACSRAASSASSASTRSSRSARRCPSKAQVDADRQTLRGGLHRPDALARHRPPVRQGRQPAARAEDRLRHVAVAAARRGARRCARCSNTTSPSRSRTSPCPSSPSTRISASR